MQEEVDELRQRLEGEIQALRASLEAMGSEDEQADAETIIELKERHQLDISAKNEHIEKLSEEILSYGTQVEQVC